MKNLAVGMQTSIKRTFSQKDYMQLQTILHKNSDVSKSTDNPLPEPLLASLFTDMLGTKLPGVGTNYLKQHLEFVKPAYYNQEITAIVKVISLRPDKKLVNLETNCYNTEDELVCTGEALVLAKDVEGAF